jgi:hypothetical protein
MYEDMLKSESDICAFLSVDVIHPELKEYFFEEHIPKRAKKKVFAKVIVCDSDINQEYSQTDKEQYRETLVVSEEYIDFANEIDVYGPNKVIVSMYAGDELFGMIIHSKKLHDTLLSIFNLVWKAYK